MKEIQFKQVQNSCCSPEINRDLVKPDSNPSTDLPVVIIGAGPIGLAAAAHLIERGERIIIFESGSEVGSHIKAWGHVQVFSPWQYNIDKAAARLLEKTDWERPNDDDLPTGKELLEQYLYPLSRLPEIESSLKLNAKVTAVSRKDMDKMKTLGRESQPFIVFVEENQLTTLYEAKAVIDASGTWGKANPIHSSGIWTKEEGDLKEHIYYGIPDIKNRDGERFNGKKVAVIGGGHSAINSMLELSKDPNTEIFWIMRKSKVGNAYGGEDNDQLKARGALGSRIHRLVDQGRIKVFTPFRIHQLKQVEGKINIIGMSLGEIKQVEGIDEIVVNTGSRPDFSFISELRLSIDQTTEGVETLAPLIDPNVHSCGTVRPHGEKELRHLEENFYIVGMKSYGRAPTFLMATGYEQVRSIAAYLAGDYEGAEKVELELPETGVCSINNVSDQVEESCCSTTPATKVSSCCS
ncbi:FAD-dependent oxidoreductase [Paenibacillus provencensis]|uniref:FAD-dependent oxidoreductase n=1 Tax=Paenibacillus provencensis TaxID=441151 RepID=A0ABW3PV98_9BACL|nr:FAD-dependent oxidoreductase [Paenibacillus sp. MER 78]MCM3127149.1 NAD(P)-binding domain-containing protein [Paenibacillus sp. MER 78]